MVLRFFLLAVAFLFSCTSVERDNCLDSGGTNYMKCDATNSSSSSSESSQSSVVYSDSVVYGGETYKTVVIGTQIWLARNLNYNPGGDGSKCFDEGRSGIDNCAISGRIYDWATAMALDASCNSSSCASKVGSKHRGICPEGWHIPSDAEWTTLTDVVGIKEGYAEDEAIKLQANSSLWYYDIGTDIYGFAALPSTGPNYLSEAWWWSTTESGAKNAYYRYMGAGYVEMVLKNFGDKYDNFYSVRCIYDHPASKPVIFPSSSSSVPSQSGVIYDEPVDYKDKTYKTVKIGTQVWMAENLNYAVSGSKCGTNICGGYSGGNCDYYELSDANTATCDTYGRLYDWATAMALPPSCNSSFCADQVESKHKGICPDGWHIPSDRDWATLRVYVRNNYYCYYEEGCLGSLEALKTTSGWPLTYEGKSGNGTDKYGFSALPGGSSLYNGDVYNSINERGHSTWWSATEYERTVEIGNESTVENGTYYWGIHTSSIDTRDRSSKGKARLSVRCLKN